MTTFVVFTLFRTDNPYSSISLSMAQELAKTNPVIYVNHPYSFKDLISGIKASDPVLKQRLWSLLTFQNRYETVNTIPNNFIAVQPPVTLPINWLPNGAMYRFLQSINNAIVANSIQKALKKQQTTEFVYINCYDPFFLGWLPKHMNAKMSIYHCIDDISQNEYTARHGERLENEAIAQSDLTFVTSTNLYTLKKPFTQKIVTYFNAADVNNFKKVLTEKYPVPEELKGRTGKVIGFVGNLDELRIDFPLLKKIALEHTDKTLLLVGPLNSPEPAAIGLDKLPNVVWAGSRRLQELPPLLQYMDVVLIPFLKNTLTKSIYPLKINEYLAAGKPVVATSFSDDIRTFAHCAYIANTTDDFVQYIDQAIAENNPEKISQRTATAATNTWEARIQDLHTLIKQYQPNG
jgi:teichuronic acid biosynthesis glycosyltransferase TuaH